MTSSSPICRSFVCPGLFDQASRIFGPGSSRLIAAFSSATDHCSASRRQLPTKPGAFPDGVGMLKGGSLHGNFGPQFLGSFAKKFHFCNAKENVSSPFAISFRSFIHSGSPKEVEMERNSRSMNLVRNLMEENGKSIVNGSQYGRFGVEQNADIVHIKMIRNNTFVTVTDSKGNKKAGASSGCLTEMKGGPKVSRYAAEATAEHVGRLARNMGLKSVVMKVNGFTYFKKKKQAILSFREGYTHSRGDQNPIVYIEDTTRRPHNGCRLPKKRRV